MIQNRSHRNGQVLFADASRSRDVIVAVAITPNRYDHHRCRRDNVSQTSLTGREPPEDPYTILLMTLIGALRQVAPLATGHHSNLTVMDQAGDDLAPLMGHWGLAPSSSLRGRDLLDVSTLELVSIFSSWDQIGR